MSGSSVPGLFEWIFFLSQTLNTHKKNLYLCMCVCVHACMTQCSCGGWRGVSSGPRAWLQVALPTGLSHWPFSWSDSECPLSAMQRLSGIHKSAPSKSSVGGRNLLDFSLRLVHASPQGTVPHKQCAQWFRGDLGCGDNFAIPGYISCPLVRVTGSL